MKKSIEFKVGLNSLLTLATSKKVTEFLQKEAQRCLRANGFSVQLEKAQKDRLDELRNKVQDVVGEKGMSEVDKVVDSVKTLVKQTTSSKEFY